jgi:hypothetical protein
VNPVFAALLQHTVRFVPPFLLPFPYPFLFILKKRILFSGHSNPYPHPILLSLPVIEYPINGSEIRVSGHHLILQVPETWEHNNENKQRKQQQHQVIHLISHP